MEAQETADEIWYKNALQRVSELLYATKTKLSKKEAKELDALLDKITKYEEWTCKELSDATFGSEEDNYYDAELEGIIDDLTRNR